MSITSPNTSFTLDGTATATTIGGTGGQSFGSTLLCDKGEIVTGIYGTAGAGVTQVGVTCSNGKSLGPVGKASSTKYAFNKPSGFKSIKAGKLGGVVAFIDGLISGIKGVGATKADMKTLVCPSSAKGTHYYFTGFGGNASSMVDRLDVKCGLNKRTHCVENSLGLEDPFCKSVPIDTDLLRKACAKNFTETCRQRIKELEVQPVQAYCSTHLDDPLCSCFRPVPSFIPPEIGGLQHCWNSECSTIGYKPNSQVCPPIVICKQDLSTIGDKNLLTSNVIQQDCRSTIVQEPSQPNAPITSDTPITGTSSVSGGTGNVSGGVTNNTGSSSIVDDQGNLIIKDSGIGSASGISQTDIPLPPTTVEDDDDKLLWLLLILVALIVVIVFYRRFKNKKIAMVQNSNVAMEQNNNGK